MSSLSPNIQSLNFAFLGSHDELLVNLAASAERYVFDDPNAALSKLRQLGELLAKEAAARAGIHVTEAMTQLDVIQALASYQLLQGQVESLFHDLRRAGNRAVHEHLDDQRIAFHQLKMAHQLAIWFHKTFGNNRSFKPAPFMPPSNPVEVESSLKDELDQLRDKLATAEATATEAKDEADAQRQARETAEEQARLAYEEQVAALDLAVEVEEQLNALREEYDRSLLELLDQAESESTTEQAQTIQRSKQAADDLDIDEAATRQIIDTQLRDAGWEADTQKLRHSTGTRPIKGRNLAIAEWPTDDGIADYVLFVGLCPVAVVEAKRKSTNVANAIDQAERYSRAFNPDALLRSPGGPWGEYRIPFLYSTNGRPFLQQFLELSGVWFHDIRHETNHPRALEGWHTPEDLNRLLTHDIQAANEALANDAGDYLTELRPYQRDAIDAVESGVINGRREMLVAMATGTGKTRTAIALIYRLIKSGRFQRILFLVDRTTLGEQTQDALKDTRLEQNQAFTDIYNVKEIGELVPEDDTRFHVATVQSMVRRIMHVADDARPVPISWYDCVIIDECHRGYNLDGELSETEVTFRSEEDYISKYRRVIDHFDAVKIGLTATPALHTSQIFGPPIFEYTYRRAVIDGFLVDHETPIRIITRLAEQGIRWEEGEEVQVVDAVTGEHQSFETPDAIEMELGKFNRKVTTESFNRAVASELVKEIDPEAPGKTLVFCVNTTHADLVVRVLRDAFAEKYGSVPHNLVKKITGNVDNAAKLVRIYRNEKLPKVAVTVDLLTTGIDVPDIENLVFLRRVKSRILYEQMLGRGTRLCKDLYGEGRHKTRFRIFDAVDIYTALEKVSTMKPVIQRPNVSFVQLAQEMQQADNDDARSLIKDQLVTKLRRKRFNESTKERIRTKLGIESEELADHINGMTPTEARDWLQTHRDIVPFFDEARSDPNWIYISEHEDEVTAVERGYGEGNARPEDYLESFRTFIRENINQIPALLVVTQRPRDLTRADLIDLKLKLDEFGFTELQLQSAIKDTTQQDVAASIIGYIRHAAMDQPLMPYAERVQAAVKQMVKGQSWNAKQLKWIERIGKQLEQETIVDREAMNKGMFQQQGGFPRINKMFDGKLEDVLGEITEAIWDDVA